MPTEQELYIPAQEGAAILELIGELGLDLSDSQVAILTAQQILGIADGSLRFFRNPTATSGLMTERVAPANQPQNGHDYI